MSDASISLGLVGLHLIPLPITAGRHMRDTTRTLQGHLLHSTPAENEHKSFL